MRSKGQETGKLQQGCLVNFPLPRVTNSALSQGSLSCYPNPLDLPDEFVPKEPEVLKNPQRSLI